jgi:hypothetical protein
VVLPEPPDALSGVSAEYPQRSPSQESLYHVLAHSDPALADLYEGARLLAAVNAPIPGLPWLLGHAIREIIDHIPALDGGHEPRGGFPYGRRIEEVTDTWRSHRLLDGLDDPQAETVDRVPREAVAIVADLVRDAAQSRNRRERLHATFAERAPNVGPERHSAWAKELRDLYEENARRAHTGKPWSDPHEYRESFRKVEIVLAGIFGEYTANRGVLNAILAEANL